MDLEQLVMSFLRGEGVLCHSRVRLTVGYRLDLDSGIPLTWPLVKAILGGLDDPDATVKDWIFTCETGDFGHEGVQRAFGVLKGAYAVRQRTVKRFRFETRDENPWTILIQGGFQTAWQKALNRLVDYVQS